MGRLKLFAIAGIMAVQAATALAADMQRNYPGDLPLPTYQSPRPRVYDAYSGWYLRGDIGYHASQISSAQSATGFASPSSNSLGNGITAGLGVGIKRDWLRTDVTFDVASSMKYTGTVVTPGDVTAKLSAWNVLLNGYLDLGTWYRASPYIGAGIGAARVSTSDYVSTVTPPFSAGATSSQWNLAWAGMAGVGYKVGSNIIFDLGYRYINYGNVKSGADTSGFMTFKGVAAHEVRVGIRWSFDDLPVTN